MPQRYPPALGTRIGSRTRVGVAHRTGGKPSRARCAVDHRNLVLALPGALGGLLCAFGLQRLFVWLRPEFLSRIDTIGLNLPVLTVAIGTATLTVLICTWLPLHHAVGVAPHDLLRGGASGVVQPVALRGRLTMLMVVEIALGLLLVAAATIVSRDLLARWPENAVDW